MHAVEFVFNLKDCPPTNFCELFASCRYSNMTCTNFFCIQIEIYVIKKHENTIQIKKLLTMSHNGKCKADLVRIINIIRKAAL